MEGHNDDGLGAGSIGLLILILGTIAIIVIFIFNKHQKHNIAENIFQRGKIHNCVFHMGMMWSIIYSTRARGEGLVTQYASEA